MKKRLLILLVIVICSSSYSQDWSNVYRKFEEVSINEGLEDDYYEFEKFWSVVNEKLIKEGKLLGWFLWKVDKKINEDNTWADYIIINVFKDKKQMNSLNERNSDWWVSMVKEAHKGITKKSIVKKYIKETLNNKYRKKSVTYFGKGLHAFMSEDASPQAGIIGYYGGMEQLNEDYVDFEIQFFAPRFEKSKRMFYWELNEIVERSENGYKPVSHIIFNIPNPNPPESGKQSFQDKIMSKYGVESRKMHGYMGAELMLWKWVM